ncbi:MAG: polysaccharide deacetylase [Oscillospiraceae bacterium]|jgi:peptidoglycan/xylan/chitin deacetylase (PgdA/CDA1 family)|nr:polysaccharide deacetylase [Oscillospiraceae bacterium]
MVIKINYKIVSFFCAVLLVFTLCSVFETEAVNAHRQDGVLLPVVMYHHMIESRRMLGDYIISPDEFENDLKFLSEKGFSTVVIADLINYVEKGTPLPKNPIMLTFDDGQESILTYAYPLLQKYGQKAVVSVVGSYIDLLSQDADKHVNYSYMTWDQISTLHQSGIFEIQNHTYNMHEQNGKRQGARIKRGESVQEYQNALTDDVMACQQKIKQATGTSPSCFTYPFGFISRQSKDIIKKLGFKASLSCEVGINIITKEPESLYLLKRSNRPHGISTDTFFKKLLKDI